MWVLAIRYEIMFPDIWNSFCAPFISYSRCGHTTKTLDFYLMGSHFQAWDLVSVYKW